MCLEKRKLNFMKPGAQDLSCSIYCHGENSCTIQPVIFRKMVLLPAAVCRLVKHHVVRGMLLSKQQPLLSQLARVIPVNPQSTRSVGSTLHSPGKVKSDTRCKIH